MIEKNKIRIEGCSNISQRKLLTSLNLAICSIDSMLIMIHAKLEQEQQLPNKNLTLCGCFAIIFFTFKVSLANQKPANGTKFEKDSLKLGKFSILRGVFFFLFYFNFYYLRSTAVLIMMDNSFSNDILSI